MKELQRQSGWLGRVAILVAFCLTMAAVQPVALGSVGGVVEPDIKIGERIVDDDGQGRITGEYTVSNSSNNLYMFAFMVTNLAAAFPDDSHNYYENAGLGDSTATSPVTPPPLWGCNWRAGNVGTDNWDSPIADPAPFSDDTYPTWSQVFGSIAFPFHPDERAFAYSVALTIDDDNMFHLPGTLEDLIVPSEIRNGFLFSAVGMCSDAYASGIDGNQVAYNDDTGEITFSDVDIQRNQPPVTESAVPEASSVIVWSLLAALGSVAGWRRCRRTKSE
jgi:hypothetical protein